MTARLLPALQKCFKSEYVSVRIEAAMVSETRSFSKKCLVYLSFFKLTDYGIFLWNLLKTEDDDNILGQSQKKNI